MAKFSDVIKRISICALLLYLCITCLSGCDEDVTKHIERYDDGYDEGYYDGYNEAYDEGYDEGYDNGYYDGEDEGYSIGYDEGYYENYSSLIIDLLYEHEYSAVSTLLDDDRNTVEDILYFEFGVTDLDYIIDYIDELSVTVLGNCHLCDKPVYAVEYRGKISDAELAHKDCLHEQWLNEIEGICDICKEIVYHYDIFGDNSGYIYPDGFECVHPNCYRALNENQE